MALTFREKLQEVERMEAVAALFEARRVELGLPVRDAEAVRQGSASELPPRT